MTYVLPQVRVFLDVNLRPVAELRPQNAFICGGHATLYRCSEAAEKAQVGLGTYDHVGTQIDGDFKTCYSWPLKPASAIVDLDYTKLCVDDALLRYWTDNSSLMEKKASNKIRQPSKNFKDNPTDAVTYPRHADFLDRDVQIGDSVRVIGSDDGGTTLYNLCTFVKDIEADQVAASIAAAATDADNAADSVASTNATANAANTGTVAAPTVNAGWSGLTAGLVSETYTVEVTQASTGGDHTTAILRVTSASGKDNDLSVTPAAAASPTSIGALGLSLTFAAGDFVVGDKYTITVAQNFEKPTPISGGTFVGTKDITYIIEVTKGGDYALGPQITVTTTDGTDFSGPHTISDLYGGTTSSTTSTTNDPNATDTVMVSIGTKGVQIGFTGYGLRLGDRYTIKATAAKDGNFRTLVLGHDLDAAIPVDDAATAALDVALYIKKDIEVGENHVRVGGQVNWDQSDTEFCAHAGIEAFDSTWTDNGVPVALPVVNDPVCLGTNQMYLEYRAWDQTLTNSVEGLRNVADLDTAVSGPLTPDNPLKWHLFKALSNNNNREVKYLATSDPSDVTAWQTVLDKISERVDVYGLVPITYDKTVLDLFQAHCQSSSDPSAGRWRVLWTNLDNNPTVVVADESTANEVILATTEDDAATSGTQYTILRGPSGKGYFSNVRVNDTVRYKYAVDAWGDSSYSEFVVAEVVNDDTLRLVTGTTAAQNTPIKVEVWRTLTVTEQAEALAARSGNWSDELVRSVWPNKVSSGGTEMDGTVLCAALAALSGGVVPQQALTNLEIVGFDDLSETTKKFNRTQLDTMAESGTWIVTQHPQTGQVYSRHGLTTANKADPRFDLEMVVRNKHSIAGNFMDAFAPYIGVANVVQGTLEKIEAETLSRIQFLRTSGETQLLGGQLRDGSITELRQSVEFKNRVLLGVDLTLPVELDNLDIHLNLIV